MVLSEGQIKCAQRTGSAVVVTAAVTGVIPVITAPIASANEGSYVPAPAAAVQPVEAVEVVEDKTAARAAGAVNTALPKVTLGDSGDAVGLVQDLLDIAVTKDFDPATYEAVKTYQAEQGLKVDGVVGKHTWGSLAGPGEAPAAAPAPEPAPAAPAVSGGRQAIVDFARAQLGEWYSWGAVGPSTWDCSGLTQAAYRAIGIEIPRVSRDQARAGVPVSRAEAQPGDLVVYPGHVAIYVGGDRMIAAPRAGKQVQEQTVYGSPTFRRIG